MLRYSKRDKMPLWAAAAACLGAHIAALDPAARVHPGLLCGMQQLAGRTAVGIGCSIIAEVLAGEAAFLLELTVAFVRRHVGLDAVILAGLDILTVIIAGIGQYLHGLGLENLLGRFCHLVWPASLRLTTSLATISLCLSST